LLPQHDETTKKGACLSRLFLSCNVYDIGPDSTGNLVDKARDTKLLVRNVGKVARRLDGKKIQIQSSLKKKMCAKDMRTRQFYCSHNFSLAEVKTSFA